MAHYLSIYIIFILLLPQSAFAQAQPNEEQGLPIKETIRKIDSLDWGKVDKSKVEKALTLAEAEYENIAAKEQKLEVNTMARGLRINVRSSLKKTNKIDAAPNNAPTEEYKDVSKDNSVVREVLSVNETQDDSWNLQQKELALLREQKDKKRTEMAVLKQTLALQAKAIELQDLEQQRLYYISGGIFLVLMVIVMTLYRSNKVEKKSNKLLAAEKKLTETERDKSDELLLNILPLAVAQELKATGKAQARNYELATVMFTDFKGFTTIAETMTPTELIAELDACFVRFDEIISKYSIEKIKTIGDAYMCVGGIPEVNLHNPIVTVLAGLEIQRFMEQKRAERLAQGQDYWQVRLGINSGELVAGVIGKKKFAYDVWGDTVNTASRMESSGEPSKVNISGKTYELVKEFFVCEYRGRINAKNKGDVDMYFVTSLKPEYALNENGIEPNETFWDKVKAS
jgi:class 3 adenylate cyclase